MRLTLSATLKLGFKTGTCDISKCSCLSPLWPISLPAVSTLFHWVNTILITDLKKTKQSYTGFSSLGYAFFCWIAPFCVFPYLQQIVSQFLRFEKLISNCQNIPFDLQRLGFLKYKQQCPCYWKQFWKDFLGLIPWLVWVWYLWWGIFFVGLVFWCYFVGVFLFVLFLFVLIFFFFLSRFISELFLKVHLAQTQHTTKYIKFFRRTFQETSDIQKKKKAPEIFITCYLKYLVNNGQILYQQVIFKIT